MKLTQKRLKKLLIYDPSTGKFTWREDRSNVIRAGMPAGSLNSRGYFVIQVDGRSYIASRLAHLWMTGLFPPRLCDHRDGNTQNDRWGNIRKATIGQNGKNRKINANNKLGLKGVHPYKGKYKAQIQVDSRKIHLGTFSEPRDAALAYKVAANRYHGEFARY